MNAEQLYNMPNIEELVRGLKDQNRRGTDGGDGLARHSDGASTDIALPQQPTKPALSAEALHGLAGKIVKTIAPFSEADPVAILVNTLTAFGNLIGPNPYFRVEHTRHHLNLFAALVGDTSKGRKGTSWSTPKKMLSEIDPAWAKARIAGGLSSGEGLVYAVRDERWEEKPIKDKSGRVTEYQKIRVDPGADDRRLMLIEEELAQALKVMDREGNILSAIIRQAWDGGNLSPLTKSNPITATGAHISIIGHITRDELLRYLNATEQANGFANRFVWLMVYRSKYISNPTGVPDELLIPLVDDLRDCVWFAHRVAEIKRTDNAENSWSGVYPPLSEGKPGLIGAVLGRAEAQVMRLACLYALMDCCDTVDVDHLHAALALWDYAEQSALVIFGELHGDPTADRIMTALDRSADGLSETDIRDLFGRNKSTDEIQGALSTLGRAGKVKQEVVPTGRHPKTIWRRNDINDTNDIINANAPKGR